MRAALAMVVLMLAGPAQAHPHVFIDTVIKAMFDDQGQVDALEITWTYDDLYSLMIMQERGLDTDGDGALTDAETASLQGYDMNWEAGYEGDTHVLLQGQPVAITGPSDWTARVEGGYIISTHIRHLVTPVRPMQDFPLIIQSYDPTYYIAYTIMDGLMQGEDASCDASVHAFDPAMADAALTQASEEYAASSDPNMDFPKIGAAYADEVWVSCAPK